jgi:hypothetical protein
MLQAGLFRVMPCTGPFSVLGQKKTDVAEREVPPRRFSFA